MKSKRNFRKNTKKNKTRKKRGGGPEEDAKLLAAVDKWQTTHNQINAILDKGANVNARDDSQRTPLHIACVRGDVDLAMFLVNRGADIHARGMNQRTPLHLSVINI